MEKNTEKDKRFTLRNEIAALAAALLFSFTVFFFAPGELYCRNPLDYVLGDRQILLPMLLLALAVTAGLTLLGNLLMLINEKLFHGALCLLFGVTLAGYVQMTFCNRQMQQIDGNFSNVYPLDLHTYLNFFLMFLLIVLPLIVYAAFLSAKKQPKIQYLSGLCMLLMIMQSAGFFSVYIQKQKNVGKKEDYQVSYLSYDPMLSLSKEKNIMIILLDTMDGYWTDIALEAYPEIADMLEGFTYYQNNISVFPHTFPSVPQMLSGIDYQNQTCADYLDLIWNSRNLPQILHENNYTVNMILDGTTTFQNCGQIENAVDNIRKIDPPAYNYCGKDGIIPVQIRLALLRMLPYMMKEFVEGVDGQLSNGFIVLENLPDDFHKTAVTAESDNRFYAYLQANGLRADSDKPVFAYYHLDGPHDNNMELESGYDLPDTEKYPKRDASHARTIRADLEIVDLMLKQMKELGIFDQTTILILGDHGHSPTDFDGFYHEDLPDEILTALMVKPEGAPHEKLKYDPDTALSNGFIPASVLEYAGIDHSEYGLSFQDVISQKLNPERRWVYHQFQGFFADPLLRGEYTVSGNARDFNNWKKVS